MEENRTKEVSLRCDEIIAWESYTNGINTEEQKRPPIKITHQTEGWLCCQGARLKTIPTFLKHIKKYHMIPSSGLYACPKTDCKRTDMRPSGIMYHLENDHGIFHTCCKYVWQENDYQKHVKEPYLHEKVKPRIFIKSAKECSPCDKKDSSQPYQSCTDEEAVNAFLNSILTIDAGPEPTPHPDTTALQTDIAQSHQEIVPSGAESFQETYRTLLKQLYKKGEIIIVHNTQELQSNSSPLRHTLSCQTTDKKRKNSSRNTKKPFHHQPHGWRCCSNRSIKTYLSLFNHIQSKHKINDTLYACPIDNCTEQNTKPSAIVYHLQDNHGLFYLCCKSIWQKNEYEQHAKELICHKKHQPRMNTKPPEERKPYRKKQKQDTVMPKQQQDYIFIAEDFRQT